MRRVEMSGGPILEAVVVGAASVWLTRRLVVRWPKKRRKVTSGAAHCGPEQVRLVKAALGSLDEQPELRARVAQVVADMATSPRARESEAGRVLLDYYVKRVGTHEVVMERLYLSRPTFYRRLKLGITLVARRVPELAA